MSHSATSVNLEKHRDELEGFYIDFVQRLASGETISSVAAVRVHDGEGQNVSAQFGSPAGAVDGTKAVFTLADAQASSDQLPGVYTVYCEIVTSEGRRLVETPSLTVGAKVSIT